MKCASRSILLVFIVFFCHKHAVAQNMRRSATAAPMSSDYGYRDSDGRENSTAIPQTNKYTSSATDGGTDATYTALQSDISQQLYKPNIDSVRIAYATTANCTAIDFTGLAYVNSAAIGSWQWYFGDGGTGNSQMVNHDYGAIGTYTVKLVVTDVNGDKDSIETVVATGISRIDFNYTIDACNPVSLTFNCMVPSATSPYWDFGDGATSTAGLSVNHTYAVEGDYFVKFVGGSGICRDTTTKLIIARTVNDNIILTPDTTICYNSTKQLRALPGMQYCWTPATFLDDPSTQNPVTSTTQPITYYLTTTGADQNLIVNGNFSQGNTGFTSGYTYNPSSGINSSVYTVASNSTAWHSGFNSCGDHTSGTGNMMMFNGTPRQNVIVWSETVSTQSNVNYTLSCWLQNLLTGHPAELNFFINGEPVGNVFTTPTLDPCRWTQLFAIWNSGSATSATITIVNQNLYESGNDFALDDIAFAAYSVKRDSVMIKIDTAAVNAGNDTLVCNHTPLPLYATGSNSYLWTPAAGLDNPQSSMPVASINGDATYVVTGSTAFGCTAKDSTTVTVYPLPITSVTNDTIICKNSSLPLLAQGGVSYVWQPDPTLNDPSVANPVVTPAATTTYHVTITDNNSCPIYDSVEVMVFPDPVFTVNAGKNICFEDTVGLLAAGGDQYQWAPAASLNDASLPNPFGFPTTTTTYAVTITELNCNQSATLNTTVTVHPLPTVQASSSNDLDCALGSSQLNATGAASYTWSPASSLSNPTLPNPIARPSGTTQYYVTGKSNAGCLATDSVTVAFSPVNKGGYLMPNAFTPNNDGLNDCFGVKYWGVVENIRFSIYNRWGQRIFYSTSPDACWDGTYMGAKQDPGVFVYTIEANTACEPKVFRKGTFVLIR